MLIQLQADSREPIYRQIIRQITELIERGALPAGKRLPSTRRLAEQLGIHRSTVATAYQELWSLGYLDMRPGSFPRVRKPRKTAASGATSQPGKIDWQRLAAPAAEQLRETFRTFHPESSRKTDTAVVNLSRLEVDPRLVPFDRFRTCLNRAMHADPKTLCGYGGRRGFPPLREAIARRMQAHGISVGQEEIIVTNGSMHGIDLVLRMLAGPKRRIAVESPTYAQIIPLIRFQGLETTAIPMKSDGLDLDCLRQTIRTAPPVLLYTMPNFQNPTGITSTPSHRENLLALCEESGLPILEDGFEEEMKYFGKVALPIKSLDRSGIVIYCGSFSKILFPGLRIGWIAADRQCIERITAIRRFTDLSSGMILQAGLHEFIEQGFFDLHVQRMHRTFRKRMETALTALRKTVSREWAEWREPAGGYLIWLQLKRTGRSPIDWPGFCARHRVYVSPGDYFFPDPRGRPCIRLSIATLNEEEITEGIRRLGNLLEEVCP